MSKPSGEPIDKNEERKEKFLERVKKWKEEGHKLSGNEEAQLKFWESEQKLPICVNEGCDNLIIMRNWGNVSQKSECSTCTGARKRGEDREGITILRKKFCENIDSHLGFKCPIPPDVWPNFDAALQLDHKDGDHFNNFPANVETLCAVCHARKSNEQGDVNSNKLAGRKLA